MGKCCIVYGCCSKTPELDVSFHVLPKDSVTREKWIANIPRTRKILELSSVAYVCSLHFEESNFRYTKSGVRTLNGDAVPTVFFSPKLVIRAMKSSKRTFATRGYLDNILSPQSSLLKQQSPVSPENPVKLLLEDQMITSFEDVSETKKCEESFITYAGNSLLTKGPAFEAVHRINIKTLLQHFCENVGDDITNTSNDDVIKNALFIRDGKELFAAVVEKSKNSSPGGGMLLLKEKYGGMWKTKHILRINGTTDRMVIKNVDFVAKIEDPDDVFPSTAVKTVAMIDDLTCGPPTDNSEKCVTIINQKEDEVCLMITLAEKGQMGKTDAVSSSEQARCMRIFTEEEQMLERKDVSSSEQTIFSPTKMSELRFECESCKTNNETVFMKPLKIATEFTIFVCPTEKCVYPLSVKHLYRFIFKNLSDGRLLACNPDNAPTVHDIVSILQQSFPQNKSSPMSVP